MPSDLLGHCVGLLNLRGGPVTCGIVALPCPGVCAHVVNVFLCLPPQFLLGDRGVRIAAFGVQGSGFRVWDLVIRFQGSGDDNVLGIEGSWIQGFGCLGFRVSRPKT